MLPLLRVVAVVALAMLTLACDRPDKYEEIAPINVPREEVEAIERTQGEVVIEHTTLPAGRVFTTTTSSVPIPNTGVLSLEEQIVRADVISRVSLDTVSSGVTTAYFDESSPTDVAYIGHIDFTLSVLEYLKGSGPNEITAVALALGHDGRYFDTRAEMENVLPSALSARDTRWDDREAVVFLRNNYRDGSHAVFPYVRQSGRYYLGFLSYVGFRDSGYTVSSRWSKTWLPKASAPDSGGGDETPAPSDSSRKEFLLDAPPPTSSCTPTGPTITLADLKSKVTSISNRLAENGGSEEQRECVRKSYMLARFDAQDAASGIDSRANYRIEVSSIQSGQAAGTSVFSDHHVPTAAARWTNKARRQDQDLRICTGCSGSPDDGYTTTIISEERPGLCGRGAPACVKGTEVSVVGGGPTHRGSETMSIISNPVNRAGLIIFLSDRASDHLEGTVDPLSGNTLGRYYYIGTLLEHEFGHTLGMPDFYKYDSLKNLYSIMAGLAEDSPVTIQPLDIEYIEKIFRYHSPHR